MIKYEVLLRRNAGGGNFKIQVTCHSTNEARQIAENQNPGCKAESVTQIRG